MQQIYPDQSQTYDVTILSVHVATRLFKLRFNDEFLPSVGVSSISKSSVEALDLIQTLEDISATKT
jgi:hypothetical protein